MMLLWRLLPIAALMISASPPAMTAEDPFPFCAALKQAVFAAKDQFESIKGEAVLPDSWKTSFRLKAAKICLISTYEIGGVGPMKTKRPVRSLSCILEYGTQEEYARAVKACFPTSDWEPVIGDDLSMLNLNTGILIRVFNSRPPDSQSIITIGELPEELVNSYCKYEPGKYDPKCPVSRRH